MRDSTGTHTCQLVACKHPFKFQNEVLLVEPFKTVTELVRGDCGLTDTACIVLVGDTRVPEKYWNHVRIKPNQCIYVRAVPQGGDDKNPLATILSIALLAVAPHLAGTVWGLSGLTYHFAVAGIGILGSLAINAIAPPPKLGRDFTTPSKESPTFSIEGTRNKLRPFHPIPVLLGHHRIVPPLGTAPYTEIQGNDQYLSQLFVLGYGPIEASDFKIGETDLDDFQDVELEFLPGEEDDPELTLVTDTVLEESLALDLTDEDGAVIQTTQPDTDAFIIDITFPLGLTVFDQRTGGWLSKNVQFSIEYKDSTDSDWSAAGDHYKQIGAQTVVVPVGATVREPTGYRRTVFAPYIGAIYIDKFTGKAGLTGYRQGPTRRTPVSYQEIQRVHIPSNGIEIARVRSDASGHAIVTDTRGASLFNSSESTTDFAPSGGTLRVVDIAAGGLRHLFSITSATSEVLRVSERIVPAQRGQFDVRITRLTADSDATNVFDDSVWSALRSVRKKPPISFGKKLSLAAIRIKATGQLNGIVDQFNCMASSVVPVYNSTTGLWDTLRASNNPAALYRYVLLGAPNIRAATKDKIDDAELADWYLECEAKGYACNQYVDFTASVFDILQSISSAGRASPGHIDGLYTVVQDKIKNTVIQYFTPTNASNFRGRKAFVEAPHGFRVRFLNEEMGFGQDERIVYDDGFSQANATKFETLPLPGTTDSDLAWRQGRYHIATIKLRPELLEFEADFENLVATRGDRIKVQHDVPGWGISSGRIIALTTSGENIVSLALTNAVTMAAGRLYNVRVRKSDGSGIVYDIVNVPGEHTTITLITPGASTGGAQTGDLFLFGIKDSETEDLVIKSIEPQADLTAKITAVHYDESIYNADSEVIPVFESNITLDQELLQPSFDKVISDESVMARDADGSLRTRTYIKLGFTSSRPLSQIEAIECRYRISGGNDPWISTPLLPADVHDFYIEGVTDVTTYDIEIRYRYKNGRFGNWTTTTHLVTGKSNPPPDLITFTVQRLADGTREYSWSGDFPPDFDGVKIRFTSGSGGTWESGTPLHIGVLKAAPFESNQLSGGTYTLMAKMFDTSGNQSVNAIVIQETLGDPRIGNALTFIDVKQDGFSGTKTNCFVDASGCLLPNSQGDWSDLPSTWGEWTSWNNDPVDSITYEHSVIDVGAITQITPVISVDADSARVAITESHCDDDVTYTSFAAITGEIFARYVKIKIEVTNPTLNGIKAASITMDAEVTQEEIVDLDTSTVTGENRIAAGNIRLPIIKTYASIRTVQVALQSVGSGWSWELIDKDTTNGPEIKIYNSDGALADATIDAMIRGV